MRQKISDLYPEIVAEMMLKGDIRTITSGKVIQKVWQKETLPSKSRNIYGRVGVSRSSITIALPNSEAYTEAWKELVAFLHKLDEKLVRAPRNIGVKKWQVNVTHTIGAYWCRLFVTKKGAELKGEI